MYSVSSRGNLATHIIVIGNVHVVIVKRTLDEIYRFLSCNRLYRNEIQQCVHDEIKI